jgi:hypothetical protein
MPCLFILIDDIKIAEAALIKTESIMRVKSLVRKDIFFILQWIMLSVLRQVTKFLFTLNYPL